MDLEQIKDLEKLAAPIPWKWRELICFGHGRATGPAHEIPKDQVEVYPWLYDAHLLVTLRNLAPELLALWEVCESQRAQGVALPEPICDAIAALTGRAAMFPKPISGTSGKSL